MRAQPTADIWEQYARNEERWGHVKRTPAEHLLIATEELGEVARAMQGDDGPYQWPPAYSERVYAELCDLGAVVLAMMVDAAAVFPAVYTGAMPAHVGDADLWDWS